MLRLPLLFVLLFFCLTAHAQSDLRVLVRDKDSSKPLIGVTVTLPALKLAASTDHRGGVIFKALPVGTHIVQFKYVGYRSYADILTVPVDSLEVFLEEEESELDEVIVATTRSSRTIDDLSTRVEAISGEELAEKGNMKPGDIRMLLNESTGIQTQQTSATSGSSSIRIQGLDGRYTQVVRDGFPLYSGFSGGLGLLQIAPLDLAQVEVIKGASSTLYGGGAIAGLVNLISKKPTDAPKLNFMLNATSALGLDASGFYSGRGRKVGTTVFAAYSHGTPYDPAGIGLTAIPEFDRVTFNPRLFVEISKTSALNVGLNSTLERRLGGDIDFINGVTGDQGRYFEKNETGRYSTQLAFDHRFSDHASLSLKNSLTYFDRQINIPDYVFEGTQVSSFSEAAFASKSDKADWIVGLNFLTDQFREPEALQNDRDYNQRTFGAFLQNNWTPNSHFSLETGLRADHHNDYGFFLLPRLAALYKHGPIAFRAGGGLGYKVPTVFTEEAERMQFRDVLPIEIHAARAERSYGANVDINYRTLLFQESTSLTVNQLFFFTRITNPLVLESVNNFYRFAQPDGYLTTRGVETNLKLTFQELKLFVGYTYASARQRFEKESAYPLVPKHRVNNVLMYEVEDQFKVGLEAYYYSRQQLNDGATGRSYWLTGLMGEKIWERFSLFINFENLLDTRQTRFDTIFTGSIQDPQFRDIYAPVDGFVVNGGIKLKL